MASLRLPRPTGRPRRLAFLAALVAAPLALGAAWLLARETSVFELRDVTVRGAPADLAADVRAAVSRFRGHSLAALAPADVEAVVQELPGVREASVDRDFPHTVRVEVEPERALAVLRRETDSWLVAASGKVLQPLERGDLRSLPRVWIPRDTGPLAPGDHLAENQGAPVVDALARIPATFPVSVDAGHMENGSLVLKLAGDIELRLGQPGQIERKAAAAAAVLPVLESDTSDGIRYLDVSLPSRPVSSINSQVQGIA